jgi:pyridoxamine 5'-phosphate oxidase
VDGSPFERFAQVYARARQAYPKEHDTLVLATADAAGAPSSRVVLLKGFDERGFVFYTNLTSRKGQELHARPRAAMCFFWPALEEQVRAEGPVSQVSDTEADAYFATRARGSQLGAWASHQSAPLGSREELEGRVRELEKRFAGGPVSRPPFWSGFRLNPDRMEFWHGRADRLHDRTVFLRDGNAWRSQLLNP